MKRSTKVVLVFAWSGVVAGTAEASTVTFGYTGGEQIFTAPVTGQYDIVAIGAKGGDAYNSVPFTNAAINSGGAGAFVDGTFNLASGDQLDLYVGGVGGNGAYSRAGSPYAYGAGGGGGTFIALNGGGYIEIAGGGGGAGIGSYGDGQDGQYSGDAYFGPSLYGGANGYGGLAGNEAIAFDHTVPGGPVYYGSGGGGSGVVTSGQDGGLGGGQGGQGLIGGLGGGGGAAGSGGYGGGGGGDVFGDGGGGSDNPPIVDNENGVVKQYYYPGDGGGGGGTTIIGGQLVRVLQGLGQGAGYVQITYDATGGGGFSGPPHIPAVPEPAAWATMLLGIGVAGGALRRRRALTGRRPAAVAH